MAFDKTIRYSLAAGAVWACVAAALGLFNELQLLLLGSGSDVAASYGVLRPAYTTALLFGAGISFFFGGALYCVQKSEGRALRFEVLGFAAVGALQVAVIIGLITIISGGNKGREYGEMSFLSDNLIILALILFLVSVMLGGMGAKDTGYSPTYIGVIVTTAALATVFFLGNMGQPHGPLLSVPMFAGLQDATVQEFYRYGLLAFAVIGGALALAYHFVPEYYGVPLHSRAMAGFQVFGTLVAFSFAAGAALAHSAAPAIGQTLGMAALVAGTAAILSGALAVSRTVTASAQPVRSDRVALFVRYGVGLLTAWAVVRALLSLRFVQASLAFTGLNSLDVARDMQTYGLLIFSGVAYLAVQRASNQSAIRLLTGWHLGLAVAGSFLLLAGDVALGLPQGLATHAVEQGKLIHGAWNEVLFAGARLVPESGKPDVVLAYLSSGRALHLLGMALLSLGGLLGAINFVATALRTGGGYSHSGLKQAA